MMEKYGLLLAQGTIYLSEAKWFWIAFGQNARLGDPQVGALAAISREGVEATTEAALVKLRQALILLDLDRMKPDLDRLENVIWPPHPGMPKVGPDAIATAITHFLSRLQDELGSQYFVHLNEQDVKFYGQKTLFGVVVADKFPKASEDIEAAGNCLALQQPTACVFHLMRTLEAGLRALATDVGLIFDKQNWHNIIEEIESAIKRERETLPKGTERDHRLTFLSAAAKEFFYFKDGWRNHVSHNRSSYDQYQALSAFEHVRTFINHLSTKLSENP